MTLELAKLLGARALPQEDSQNWKILEALYAVAGHTCPWLTMPFLVDISGSYSRIADLRRAGFDIENKTVNGGKIKQSHYRLIVPAKEAA